MKTLCAAAGAALLACNLAGFAQTETPCDQALDAPLRSRALLTIDSRPAGLEIVGTESAGINRHIVGDERALRKRRSDSILASSLACDSARGHSEA